MKFDFEVVPEQVEWLVEPLIPLGQLCFFIAQAGVGKSLLAEALVVHIVYGKPFCGFKTIEGDVLLIDQDTPTRVLEQRLIRFGRAMQQEKKHELFVESMRGYNLSDRTLITAIKDHSTVKLVIVDCLHTVCGRLNPNYTADMNVLAKLKKECLTPTRTIIFNHHITEKVSYPVERLMSGDFHIMSMGASAIVQQADTYYIIGATAEDGRTNKVYIRPIPKRVSVKTMPLVLQVVHPSTESEYFEFQGEYNPELEEVELDCLTFFREQPSDRTVKQTLEDMGHLHGEKALRKALASLSKKGLLVLSRHKANLFKYRLP